MVEVYSVTGRCIGRLNQELLKTGRMSSGRGQGIYLVKNAKGRMLMKHIR